jgi:hypothetical protein
VSRPGELPGYVAGNIARILGNDTHERRQGYVCANDTGVLWERGLVVFEPDQELACEDVLPGFRRRVADFFTLPGEEEEAGVPAT